MSEVEQPKTNESQKPCARCGVLKAAHHVCSSCVCTSCPPECDDYRAPDDPRTLVECPYVIEFRSGSFFRGLEAENGGTLDQARRFNSYHDAAAFMDLHQWICMNGGMVVHQRNIRSMTKAQQTELRPQTQWKSPDGKTALITAMNFRPEIGDREMMVRYVDSNMDVWDATVRKFRELYPEQLI